MATDGGPAFPTFGDEFMQCGDGSWQPKSAYGFQGESGMSLRDWFAGQMLAAILSSETANAQLELAIREQMPESEGDDRRAIARKIIAKRCYQQADAMLAEREVK